MATFPSYVPPLLVCAIPDDASLGKYSWRAGIFLWGECFFHLFGRPFDER